MKITKTPYTNSVLVNEIEIAGRYFREILRGGEIVDAYELAIPTDEILSEWNTTKKEFINWTRENAVNNLSGKLYERKVK